MHRWRARDLREFVPALRRCTRRRPHGVARATRTAFAQAFRDRRAPLSGPRKIYVKELIQAITLADRLLQSPDVRHLHAHFAHGRRRSRGSRRASPACRSASPAMRATSTRPS